MKLKNSFIQGQRTFLVKC